MGRPVPDLISRWHASAYTCRLLEHGNDYGDQFLARGHLILACIFSGDRLSCATLLEDKVPVRAWASVLLMFSISRGYAFCLETLPFSPLSSTNKTVVCWTGAECRCCV